MNNFSPPLRTAATWAFLCTALFFNASPAQAAMTFEQIKSNLEVQFGDTVLRVEKVPRSVGVEVTIMNPKGDFNEALQIYTIVVDPNTGRQIPGRGLSGGN